MSPHVISTRFPNLFRTLARLALAFLLSASVQAATDVQQSSIRGGGLSAFGASVAIDDCQSATWCVCSFATGSSAPACKRAHSLNLLNEKPPSCFASLLLR